MSITHAVIITRKYYSGGVLDVINSVTDTQTSGAENNIDEAITDGTNQLVAYTLDTSQVKTFAIWSSGGDMSVFTNDLSSGAPDNTFTLVDGVPQLWSTGGGSPNPSNPVTTDITALYVTNTGTATLHVRALLDPTV